jgi:Tfp pilus assembly protein PilE
LCSCSCSVRAGRFYLANRTYAATADLPALGFVGGKSEKGSYALTIPVANANTYTATATPTAGGAVDMSADVECAAFSINAQGVRTATPDPNQRCW